METKDQRDLAPPLFLELAPLLPLMWLLEGMLWMKRGLGAYRGERLRSWFLPHDMAFLAGADGSRG